MYPLTTAVKTPIALIIITLFHKISSPVSLIKSKLIFNKKNDKIFPFPLLKIEKKNIKRYNKQRFFF